MKNLCFALICSCFLITARTQVIEEALARYAAVNSTEKLYLHFDKPAYAAGETIWFKAYLMEDLLPAEKSKTVYVDWIKDDGTVLYHTVAPLIDGNTKGQFEIPADIKTDLIHVRAYTKWMLNFDTSFLFKREIPVLSKTPRTGRAKSQSVTSVFFFPEGGDLIEGAPNRVAFKAYDQWGLPSKIKGIVIDPKGSIIDSLRVQHDGMGYFLIQPQRGLTYRAKWKDEKGQEHQSELPAALTSGIAMQISFDGTNRVVSMAGNQTGGENLKQLHLVGTMAGQMAFKTDISFNPNLGAKRIIPTSSLPSGILTLTLFDAGWKAIAERIVFVDNQEYSFETSMEVLHWGLGKRKRNEIEIRLPDSLADASLSISVTDASVEKDTSETIISHFLLTSDLKGYIHRPAYYFEVRNEKRKAHLDLVMMTNGWRRFKWEEVMQGKTSKKVYGRDTSYLTLSGQLLGITKSQLSGNDNLVLIVKEKDSANSRLVIVPINTDGSFNDPQLVFFDTLGVYYSLKSKFLKQAEARFMTNRLSAPSYFDAAKYFRTYKSLSDTVGTGYHFGLASRETDLRELQRNKVMETVFIKAKTKTPTQLMEEKYPSGLFKGTDAFQFDLVNDPLALAQINILHYLQGKVPGLQVLTGSEPSVTWRGGTPLFYLDEMRTDITMVGNVPVNDVAYIKVFRPPFMGGSGGGSGAIAIYTKRGDDRKNTGTGLTNNRIVGYTPIREFYSPNYERFDARNEQPDLRTTIYWNPMVNTSSKKPSVKLSFFNNDVTKAFRVVIEGVNSNGAFTHFEQIME